MDTFSTSSDERVSRQQAALVALSSSEIIQSGDLDRVLRQITRVAAEVLSVERVGVWRLERDPVELISLLQYDLKAGRFSAGARVSEKTCPGYFRAISTFEVVAADDAASDPRTRELIDDYLKPLGITSTMDVPIYGPQGRWGVICHEHGGPRRSWRRDEQMFALGLANLISAAVGYSEQRGSEQKLQAYLENACDCMVLMDPAGRVVYANKSWSEVMGYGPEDIAAGVNVRDLIDQEARAEAQLILDRAIRGESVRFHDLALRSRDGSKILAEGSAWSQLKDGKLLQLFAHWRDTTQVRELQRYHEYFLENSAGMFHYALREPMPLTLPVEEQLDWLLRHNYMVECNGVHARFYGHPRPEDMAGSRFQDTFPDPELPRAILRTWIENGYRLENTETCEQSPSGNDRWFLGFSTGVVKDGLLYGTVGMRLDITDRKLTELALAESEEKFRQFAESVRDVFWVLDLKERRFLYLSPGFQTTFGRNPDSLYADVAGWLQAMHPEDRDWASQAYLSTSGKTFDIVYRIERPDESIGWIHDRGYPIHDENGNLVRLVGVAEDVTGIKRSEEALRASERRLSEALRNTQDRVIQLEDQVRDRQKLERLVGKSGVMQDTYRRVRLAAQSDVTALITGESGTGKELVAAAIHSLSGRHHKPFVAVNCTSIPESLLESEIFGHIKGAFTGATRDRHGLLQAAEGGTLFLDEIGDMKPALQAKLLRVLQERRYRPVGDEQEIPCDVRILAATNRDLLAAVASGDMREDFFYRIRVFQIALPPLRDRKEDIPLLVGHFIEELSQQTGKKLRGVSTEALRALVNYNWPGNVRELRNAMEHGFVTAQENHLAEPDLPPEVRIAPADRPPELTAEGLLERRRLEDALRRAGGSRTEAARLLGVSRVTLWKRIQKYRLKEG
jgi:PAS domain S-box-containing protein